MQASDLACAICPNLCKNGRLVEAERGDRKAGAAAFLIVGEGPGAVEAAQGRPFIGRAGQKLRDAVAMAGIRPENVAYTNAVRHHPLGEDGRDRAPTDEEITKCSPWLEQDIALFKPRVILCVGKVAALAIKKLQVSCQVRETLHPAYVLRMPRANEKFYQDVFDAGVAAGVTTMPIRLRMGGPPPPKNPPPWYEGEPNGVYFAVDVETDALAEEGFSARQRAVSYQTSDGIRAAFYPLPSVAGIEGHQQLRLSAVPTPDLEGPSADVDSREWTDPTGAVRPPSLRQPSLCGGVPSVPGDSQGECARQGEAWTTRPPAQAQGFNAVADSLHPNLSAVEGIRVSTSPRTGSVLLHDPQGPPRALPRPVFVHNGIFDLPLLGIDPHDLGAFEDTLLICYDLRYSEVGLKKVGPRLTGLAMKPIESVLGKGKKKYSFSQALKDHPEEARHYAMLDAVVTSRLARVLMEQLEVEPKIKKHYYELEKPALPCLYEMEENGVYIDGAALEPVEEELERIRAESTARLAEVMGEVNPGSSDQLREVLPGFGFELSKRTETGKRSVEAAVLLKEVRAESFEVLEERPHKTKNEFLVYEILRYRQAQKLQGTYVGKCREVAGGRLHGRFKQATTSTERLASEDPNLQNIPKRTELGKRIRKAFAAPPGRVLIRADLSQIEVRLLAHYTKDAALLRAYADASLDVHDMVRAELGLEAGPKNRDVAKNGVFAIAYGADVPKFAETVHVNEVKAAEVMARFKTNFPSVAGWRKQVLDWLWSEGYLETMYGWRIYAPQAWSPIYSEAQDAIRTAVNAPIQGSAAGIMKKWLISLFPELGKWGALPLLTVHDEVLIEADQGSAGEIAKVLHETVSQIGVDLGLVVPLVTEVTSGPSWTEQPTRW